MPAMTGMPIFFNASCTCRIIRSLPSQWKLSSRDTVAFLSTRAHLYRIFMQIKRTRTLYQYPGLLVSYPTLVSIITLSPCAPRNFAFHSIQLLKSCNNGHPQEQKSRQIAGKMWFKTSYSAMKPFAFNAAISASFAGPDTVPVLLTV